MTVEQIDIYRVRVKDIIRDLEADGIAAHTDVMQYLVTALMMLDKMRRECTARLAAACEALRGGGAEE